MDLLFLSSDPISIPAMEELARGKVAHTRLSAVVTNPDRRSGRGKHLQRNQVASAADALGIPVFQTTRLTLEELERFPRFDAVLVFAFGQILPKAVLNSHPDRFLNIHASPLPQLRGPSPIETAIAEGWEETEISLMKMAFRMDTGDVAFRRSIAITPNDTGSSLRKTIALESAKLIHHLPEATAETCRWEVQDESGATWCRKITKADARLDFSLPAQVLADRCRAFEGWPGATLQLFGEIMKVSDIVPTEGSGIPGEVLSAHDRLIVATSSGALSIGSIQRPSRKMLPFPEFSRGTPVEQGILLPYSLSRPLVRG